MVVRVVVVKVVPKSCQSSCLLKHKQSESEACPHPRSDALVCLDKNCESTGIGVNIDT